MWLMVLMEGARAWRGGEKNGAVLILLAGAGKIASVI
jgi:hypothetical protein